MYYQDDPYYMSPEEEARVEYRAKVERLEKELEEAECVTYGDMHGDASYWAAVERAAEIREQLKTLESADQL